MLAALPERELANVVAGIRPGWPVRPGCREAGPARPARSARGCAGWRPGPRPRKPAQAAA